MKNLSPVAFGRLRLDEIFEHIPVRTSSLNHWSVSSNTPTMSSSTSSAAPATRSRHTPDTSIDMGIEPSRKTLGWPSPGAEDIGSGPDDASASACSYWTALEDVDSGELDWQGCRGGEREDRLGSMKDESWETGGHQLPDVALASPTYAAATFSNIQDGLTSDDDEGDLEADSDGGSRLTTGELEGELLFQEECYGGLRLPGLSDPMTALPKAESMSGVERDEDPDSPGGACDADSEANGDDHSGELAPELEPAPIRRRRRTKSNGAIKTLEMDHQRHDDYDNYDCDDDATLTPSAHAQVRAFSTNDEHSHVRNEGQRDVPNNVPMDEAAECDDVNNRDEGVISARADLAPGKKGTKRISALGTGPQVTVAPPTPIMEEGSPVNEVVKQVEEQHEDEGEEKSKENQRWDKRDIKTAVRLRKEAKAKARARGAGGQAKSATVNRQFGSCRAERNSIMRAGLEAGP